MSPTNDDFEPRRDGWFEHKGTWGEVTVGTVLANRERRSERWEIIEVAMAAAVRYGHTLWMRAREQTTGELVTVSPRRKTSPAVILTQSPADTQTAPPTPPSDADAIMLLVKELGAEVMASRDNATGEIVCPDYTYDSHDGQYNVIPGLIEHLAFAHGYDTAALLAMDWEEQTKQAITTHGGLHLRGAPVDEGFPHRHVPEDLTLM